MSGILENALADAIETMREVERRMDFSSMGECKWQLIKAADLAQTALHSEANLQVLPRQRSRDSVKAVF